MNRSRTGSQERVPKNRLPGNAPKSRFLRIGSQEQIPKQGSQEQVPKQGSDKQVSSNVSKNSCPGKVPRTLNNRIRILQSLTIFSNNGTERLKKN